MVDRTFPFTQAREAYRGTEGRGHFAKVVIALNDEDWSGLTIRQSRLPCEVSHGRSTTAARTALRRDPGYVTRPLRRRPLLLYGGGTGRRPAGAAAARHRRELAALALSAGRPRRSLTGNRVECPWLPVERQVAGRNAELPRL